MQKSAVLAVARLGFPWQTTDPFLFCVYHDDHFPLGNEAMGPEASLRGRAIGQDFAGRDGWNMYHGEIVPGFPQHPHRGFETVTVVRKGLVDHSDSLGATARFGGGDAQWMTAGKGVVHAEMMPLVHRDRENPLELFQIWLNLPKKDKLVAPHFAMLWNENIPRHAHVDAEGRRSEIAIVAGRLDALEAPSPPPSSWAAQPENDVAIWTLKLAPHARLTLPRAEGEHTKRSLYFFRGASVEVAGRSVAHHAAIEVDASVAITLVAGPEETELLMLQGRPIGERVVQHGPFVMNSPEEIQQAFADYRRTQFGGWPWPTDAPVHPRERGRFARHADGRLEEK